VNHGTELDRELATIPDESVFALRTSSANRYGPPSNGLERRCRRSRR